ncbi:hypothetical protein [Caminibacter sp.]
MRKIIAFIFILLFSGCALKSALKQDPLYEKTLKYTQRCQIVNSLETKAIIDVVYLNPLFKQFKKPTFLVGIYNEFNNTINNVEFHLYINSKDVNISTKIPDFVLYKNFPFYNSWMNYYIVTTNTKPPFKIEYKSKHWGECVINEK